VRLRSANLEVGACERAGNAASSALLLVPRTRRPVAAHCESFPQAAPAEPRPTRPDKHGSRARRRSNRTSYPPSPAQCLSGCTKSLKGSRGPADLILRREKAGMSHGAGDPAWGCQDQAALRAGVLVGHPCHRCRLYGCQMPLVDKWCELAARCRRQQLPASATSVGARAQAKARHRHSATVCEGHIPPHTSSEWPPAGNYVLARFSIFPARAILQRDARSRTAEGARIRSAATAQRHRSRSGRRVRLHLRDFRRRTSFAL